MDYQKALNILGLKLNFTEEDLKKAHRKLSHEYHPDKWEGTNFYDEAIRKQQEINEARDFLRKHLHERKQSANQTPPTNQSQFDIDIHAKEKLQKLKNIINCDNSIQEVEELQEVLKKIKDEIFSFETDAITFFTTTKANIDRLYVQCIISIRMILENFVASFYQKYYINEKEVEETIDYDCNLGEFYNQLLKIKEKYSKEEKAKKRLKDEIEQYKGYAGYEKLELLIDERTNQVLSSIKQNNFRNIDQEIENMHQGIKKDIFDRYFTLKKQISELGSIVNAITDESIRNEYLNLYNSFKSGKSFSGIEESIKKLEQHISEYQEMELKKQKQKEMEDSINQIYQSLITRYSETLKQYNIVTEFEKIKCLNDFLKQILQIFTKGCEEFKSLEFFALFNNITLTNIPGDREVMENIIQHIEPHKSNVYIKTTDVYMFDDVSFFYLDEENMIMYKSYYSDINSRKITKEQLATEYVPIEQVIKSAVFVGEYKKIHGTVPIKYLYETDKIAIYYQGKKFEVKPKTKLYVGQISKPGDESFEPFKDKQYVCEMIEKQVKGAVEEYIKKQSQTSNSYSPNPNIYGQTPFNTSDGYYYDESGNRRRR